MGDSVVVHHGAESVAGRVPASPGELLRLVRSGEAITRGDLLRVTGLSRSTVTQRIDLLLDAGLLREEGYQETAGRGRPATTLAFADTAGHVLVAGLHAEHADLTVADLAGRVLFESKRVVAIADGPERVLGELAAGLAGLPAAAGLDWTATVGVALGVPGPVDVTLGRILQPPLMPGWHDHPVRDQLASELRVPVFVENDANLTALGEQRAHWADVANLVLVRVDSGIGAGIVIDGRLYRGVDGGAGDIGHIRMEGHERRCACGVIGCLAAVASGSALVAELAALGKDVASVDDVRVLVQHGDAEAVAAARRAGQLAGEVLTTVVSVLNPEILVLGGAMAHTDGHFVTGLREVIYQRSLPRATRRLRVVTARLGESASAVGAAALVVDEVFSPAAVDARLRAHS